MLNIGTVAATEDLRDALDAREALEARDNREARPPPVADDRRRCLWLY